MAVVNLDDPSDVAAWNRRAPAPAPTDAEIDAIADQHKASGYGTVWPHAFARAILAKWGAQPVAAPEGPVARIEGIDEYGPRLEWTQHWVDVGVGAKLYTASQVQAMLAAVPRNAPLYSPDDVAFSACHNAEGVDAPPELASTAKQASIAAVEVAAPSGPARQQLTGGQDAEV